MKSWVKLTYRDGWYPNGNECILTNTNADGRWSEFKYAIFGINERPHVAFYPTPYAIIKTEYINKEEAEKILARTLNAHTLYEDFKATYK